MVTQKKSRRTSSPPQAGKAGPLDALELLKRDHADVKRLFASYQELVDQQAQDGEKQPVADQICSMLSIHAQIEEDIFYPAAQSAIEEPDLVDEATIEHASAKELIAQIEAAEPSDALFDAKVKVLGEYVSHHVTEEEGELFPQVRKAKLDLKSLGEQMTARKSELMEEMGLMDEGEVP